MRDFIEYCFDDGRAPFWVYLLSLIMTGVFIAVYLTAIVAMLALGYWVVVIVMAFVIPLYALVESYERAKKEREK